MKAILFVLATVISASAFADLGTTSTTCTLEGERKYVANPFNSQNHDVYVCENGVWVFLYTRTADEGRY